MSSFRDHPRDNHVIWSLFDIRARIPFDFNMISYRFEAGYYELVFSNKKHKITLGRWGPASAHLRNRNLEEFAVTTTRDSSQNAFQTVKIGPTAVDCVVSPPATLLTPLANIGRRKAGSSCHRFLHLVEKNRILGIKIEGKKPVDTAFFERICGDFQSV
jgi:hypothetical protein